MDEHQVFGPGWCGWESATPLLDGMTCAWADVEGFHISAAPPGQPCTSHLWGWSDGRWVRVRVEPDQVLPVILTTAPFPQTMGDGVPADVDIVQLFSWDPDDQRVPFPGTPGLGRPITMRKARLRHGWAGVSTVVFFEVGQATG